MNSVKKGIAFVIASAVIFGSTPVLARIAYDEGANAVTIAFLRAALALPFLFAILKTQKISLAVSPTEARDLLLTGIAAACTTIFLYSSYAYIPVGEATTLHFIYPALVSLGCVFFYREKLTAAILTALVLSFAGVFLFSEDLSFANTESGSLTGFLFAVASGSCFAFYVIRVDKSSLRGIHEFKITFFLCSVTVLCSGIYGGAGYAGGLSFGLSLKGWVYAWIIALSVSLGGIVLLQAGIKRTGATTAAILSTFEPITSVFCGALFLGESLSLPKMIGCACIISSVILVTVTGGGRRV
ncbi:MAG: DMT family transporter [Syntrophorhabdaceae bacterium]|nr:DMT family transporter [Syntrophorhabdaceae bacterium]